MESCAFNSFLFEVRYERLVFTTAIGVRCLDLTVELALKSGVILDEDVLHI